MLKNRQFGEEIMLKFFKVKNYRGFKDELSIDFSTHRDYTFHSDFIKNGVVNKGIIYGKNGAGKSNFGFALFDIVLHLTNKYGLDNFNLPYKNGFTYNKNVEFTYGFLFGKDEIEYSYTKKNALFVLSEKLKINGNTVVEYNFNNQNDTKLLIEGTETLRLNNIKLRPEQSFVKYVYTNSKISPDSPLSKFMNFVDNMLWFRSVKDNQFSGYKDKPDQLANILLEKHAIDDFRKFLLDIDEILDFNFSVENDIVHNQKILMVDYPNGLKLPFNSIASTGTLSLWLFYCWSLEFKNISFLYIDEFDAFYHYETSEKILKYINKCKFQSFVSTHNTYLMNNSIIRPDCCFIISDNKTIRSLTDSTDKEIREAHNLERMYRNGAFQQ